MLATERKDKCTGLLGLQVNDSVLDNNDSRKKSFHIQRGTCEVCRKRTNDFCFGYKTYLCLKVPPSTDQSDSKDGAKKYVSFSDGGADNLLFENTCWMMHHHTGIECHLSNK